MNLSSDNSRRQRYLLGHSFRQFLPPQAIQALLLHRFSDGEYLCRENEPALFLHFLVEGRCKGSRFLQNGKESLICFYHNFAILGEVELIGNLPSFINTIQAQGPVWALSLPRKTAEELLMYDPLPLRFLCSHLAQKLMQSNLNLSISLNYPVDQRVASYIYCSCQGRENLFHANYTQMAEYLGCSHRQLLRVLSRFREEGLLGKEGHSYRILNMSSLERLAGDIYSP